MNRNTSNAKGSNEADGATGVPGTPGTDARHGGESGQDEGVLEKAAQVIHPPSREISDDEIMDPGANIPREPMDKLGGGKPAGSGR